MTTSETLPLLWTQSIWEPLPNDQRRYLGYNIMTGDSKNSEGKILEFIPTPNSKQIIRSGSSLEDDTKINEGLDPVIPMPIIYQDIPDGQYWEYLPEGSGPYKVTHKNRVREGKADLYDSERKKVRGAQYYNQGR